MKLIIKLWLQKSCPCIQHWKINHQNHGVNDFIMVIKCASTWSYRNVFTIVYFYFIFSHASMTLGIVMSVCQSTTFVQTNISVNKISTLGPYVRQDHKIR